MVGERAGIHGDQGVVKGFLAGSVLLVTMGFTVFPVPCAATGQVKRAGEVPCDGRAVRT